MRLDEVVELVAQRGMERRAKQAGVMLPLTVGALLPGVARRAMAASNLAEQELQGSADRAHVMGKTAGPMGPRTAPHPDEQGYKAWAAGFGRGGQHYAPATGGQAPSQSRGSASSPGLVSSLLSSMLGTQIGNSTMGQGFSRSFGNLGGAPVGGVAKGIEGGIGERVRRMILPQEFGEQRDPMHMMGTKAVEAFGSEVGKAGVGLLKDIANKAMDAVGHAGDDAAREAILGNLKRTDSVLSQADDATLMEAYNTMKRFAPVLSTDKNAVRSFLRQAVMSGSGPDFMSIKLLADSERAVTGEKRQ